MIECKLDNQKWLETYLNSAIYQDYQIMYNSEENTPQWIYYKGHADALTELKYMVNYHEGFE